MAVIDANQGSMLLLAVTWGVEAVKERSIHFTATV